MEQYSHNDFHSLTSKPQVKFQTLACLQNGLHCSALLLECKEYASTSQMKRDPTAGQRKRRYSCSSRNLSTALLYRTNIYWLLRCLVETKEMRYSTRKIKDILSSVNPTTSVFVRERALQSWRNYYRYLNPWWSLWWTKLSWIQRIVFNYLNDAWVHLL